jgi:hypothetical protein
LLQLESFGSCDSVSFNGVHTGPSFGEAQGLIRWAKHGKPRGYLVAWIQHYFRPKAHRARFGVSELHYLVEDDQ